MATASTSRTWLRVAAARVDGRLLLGVVLVAACMAAGLVFWGAVRETVPVLVAARDIPRGHILQREDLSTSAVRLDGILSDLAIPEERLHTLIGHPVGASIRRGEMVIWPDVAAAPGLGADQVAVTVPVKADTVYPWLESGDPVKVLATRAKGRPESQTATLLDRAVVYHVALRPGRVTVGRPNDGEPEHRDIASITLLVPQADAERLAHAVVNWDVTVALLAPTDGQQPAAIASPVATPQSMTTPAAVTTTTAGTATPVSEAPGG